MIIISLLRDIISCLRNMNFISVLRDPFPFSKISKIFQIDFTRIIKEEIIEIIKEE